MDEEELGVVEEAFSVREDIVGQEGSDELLELLEDGVVGGGSVGVAGAVAVIPGVGLVAVVDGSLVPP